MADQPVTREKLINADKDVDSLGEAANEVKVVNPRYGNPYYSGPMAVQHIMDMGGWDSFPTQAELQASTPITPTKVAIALDTGFLWRFSGGVWVNTNKKPFQEIYDFVNGNPKFKRTAITTENIKSITVDGDYSQSNKANAVPANGYPSEIEANDAGFLNIKSIFNEAGTISVYRLLEWRPRTTGTIFFCSYIYATNSWTDWTMIPTDSNLSALKSEILVDIGHVEDKIIKPYEIITQSPNLFDESKIQKNVYINNSGVIISSTGATGWGMSDFIPVTGGEYYTISGSRGRHGVGFYSTEEQALTSSLSYNGATTLPLTMQAPAGANFMLINVYAASTPAYSNIQVEHGSVATPYAPYGNLYEINPAYINGMGNNSKNRLEINGSNATVSALIDNVPIKLDVWLTKVNEVGDPSVFNFARDTVNNVIQRTLSDDVAPMRLDNATIGANHGYQKSNLTLAGHGKTIADIGSVWSSAGKQYVIVGIISNNVLSITSRADNSVFILAELTHVSGASNTASFTPTSTVSTQWYPAIRDRKLTCFVDNVKIDLTQDATHSFKNTVKFLESYSIMKKSDIAEWLITNKGQNHVNYNAVPAYTVNFGYTFDHECGCTIYFGGVGRKTVDLVDQMITQSIQLAQGNGTVYNYIPKAVEFTAGGFTYNFSQLENLYSKNPSAALFLTAARQEAGVNPIDRIVMLNDQVGYATGYLPVLDAAPDVRPTNASNKYLEIRNGSLKLYPRLIDSASITKINDGDSFAAIAYRKYFKRSTERTCKYVIRSEMGDYLYLDWHAAKIDDIELPADLVGREFEVVEKSDNVTLLSKFASNSILVKISNTKTYGYLVLKFK